MIIDSHHHLALAPLCPYASEYSDKIEETAAAFGLTFLCIMGLGADFPEFADNRTVLELARKNRKVLPVAYVDLDRDSPGDIRDCDAQGFAGYKVINPRRPYNTDRYISLYETMAATGKFLYFHCGMQGGNCREIDSANARPVFLDRIAHLFPEMPVVCAHLGYPWLNEALALACYHPNVYYDLTGGPMELNKEWFDSPACLYPLKWDRVLFGTDSMIGDFPIPFNRYQEKFTAFGLSPQMREQVMGKTMQKLLKH